MSLWLDQPANHKMILSWVHRAQGALFRLSELLQPFFALPSPVTVETAVVLGHVAKQCTLTSDSILALVALGKMWDAEMLVRSVVEGTLRFAYLCVSDPVERERRRIEYSETLPEIAALRRSTRAAKVLATLSEKEFNQRRPMNEIVLTTEQALALEKRYPREKAKRIEQMWSFSSLVDLFARSGQPAASKVTSLFHNYGLSSHLIHQDGTAMHLIRDREQRSPERKHAIDLAHAARELSDVIAMAALRVQLALRVRELDLEDYQHFDQSITDLRSEFHNCYRTWESIEYS